tara:strand:+ start:760 stop:1374 length:615 start_codon:yes stop_codon:yes gene_type:complete
MIRIILIALLALTLTNCSQTYKVKQEAKVDDGRLLNEVPQWYIDAEIEKGVIKNRDAEDYIYAVGQGTSPDLQLAVEKAIMIAKASLADQLEGEMNKRSELYITEIGQEGNKEVASKVESTIVNIIEQTKVQGYEEWNKAVYETPDGQYRVYIGLKMGVGDANRLAAYIVANANNDVDIDALAEAAIDELEAVPTENVTETELN